MRGAAQAQNCIPGLHAFCSDATMLEDQLFKTRLSIQGAAEGLARCKAIRQFHRCQCRFIERSNTYP